MNVKNIISKELHQMRWIIISGLLLSLGLAVILVPTFHYLDQIVEEIPPELLDLLARYEITRELLLIFGDYSIYIWSQWNAKNLFQLGALFAIIIAAFQFAGEVSRHTIGYYLTRPITRKEGYLAKVAAALLVLLIIFGGGTVLIWAVSTAAGQTADWGRFFSALLISLTWLFSYYLVGTIISIYNREQVTAGIIIGLAGILLSLPGMFALSRQFSIFYQMRAADYFVYGQQMLPSLAIGILVNAVLIIIGLRVFAKKDF